MKNIFVIDNAINCSYITSVLTALLYNKSKLDGFLEVEPENNSFFYLQELIKTNFIEKIRNFYSIDNSVLNEIRNYCIACGWKNNEYFLQLYDVGEFYDFLVKNIDFGTINYEVSFNNSTDKYCTSFIPLNIDKSSTEISIYDLFNEWINKNLIKYDDKKKIKNYELTEIPDIVTFYVNRNINFRFNNKRVDIMKNIRFNDITEPQDKLRWEIYSIVCYNEAFPQHYYSVVNFNDEWFIIDDNMIPSIFQINIKNDDYANKIKSECCLIFYIKK